MLKRLTLAAAVAVALLATAKPAQAGTWEQLYDLYEAEQWAWDLYLEDTWDTDAGYAYLDCYHAFQAELNGYHNLGRWYAMSAMGHCVANNKKPWKPSHLTCGIVQSWLNAYLLTN